MKRIYILDTTALLTWHLPSRDRVITCPHVVSEAREELTNAVLDAYLHTGKVGLEEPEDNYIKTAIKVSEETGDYIKLSETDIHVIALAIKYKEKGYSPVVVTDDYAIQNILTKLGIEYLSYYRRIRKGIKWVMICRRCGKIYPPNTKQRECIECGGEIIRRKNEYM